MRLRILTLAWLSLALAATGCSGNSTAGNSGGSTGSTAANGGTDTTGTTASSTTGGGSATTTGGASTGSTTGTTTSGSTTTTGGSGSSGSTGTTGTTGTSASGGIGCTPGHYDLDGQSANGCEVTCTAAGCTGPGGAVPMPGLAFGTQFSSLGAFSNGSNLSGPRAGASFRSVGRIADPAVGPPMAGASFKSQGGLLSK